MVQLRNEIKAEVKSDGDARSVQMLPDPVLSKDSVQGYLTRFELINNKITRLEPMLKFKAPEFHTPTELRVKKQPIGSPFSSVGAIGSACRILNKL